MASSARFSAASVAHGLDAAVHGRGIQALRHHQELVAPVADDGVRWAEGFAQGGGEPAEGIVAGLMAVEIVDLLEAVQVEEDQGGARGLGHAKDLPQRAAVGQAGEGVAVGQRPEVFLGPEELDVRLQKLPLHPFRHGQDAAQGQDPFRGAVEGRGGGRDDPGGTSEARRDRTRPGQAERVRARLREGEDAADHEPDGQPDQGHVEPDEQDDAGRGQ